jgi:UDP-4-amino-4-deoxy-L-arabinose-oxoglutarate aminotransferase
MSRLDEINSKRTELAMHYRELLEGVEEVLPLKDPDFDFKHAWHLFVIRVNSDKIDRNRFMEALKAENIGTGLHFRAVHLQKYYREAMGFKPGDMPVTEWNSDRICSLPLFPEMTPGDVEDVVTAIKKVLANG